MIFPVSTVVISPSSCKRSSRSRNRLIKVNSMLSFLLMFSLFVLPLCLPVYAGVDLKDAAKIDEFYERYVKFLKIIDKVDRDYDQEDPSFRSLVTEQYYYPPEAKSTAFTDEETERLSTSLLSTSLVDLSARYVEVGDSKEYPYIVVNAPDAVDRKMAKEWGRPLKAFDGFVIRDGQDVDAEMVDNIKNSGLIEFIPPDFYQRINRIKMMSKMVFNVKNPILFDVVDFIRRIHRDPDIGHKVIKSAIYGPKFYDLVSNKVVVYFSGIEEGFTQKVSDYFVEKNRRKKMGRRGV